MESDKVIYLISCPKSGFLGLFDVSIQFVYFPRQRGDYVVAWAVWAGGVPAIIPEPTSLTDLTTGPPRPPKPNYIYNFIEPI